MQKNNYKAKKNEASFAKNPRVSLANCAIKLNFFVVKLEVRFYTLA
jgi:hypothetical protein